MKHLTDDDLSVYLDGAMSARDIEAAERHLVACQPCREALAELASQDEALAPLLHHDPGDAYFESFPARVGDRIRSAGAPRRSAGFDPGRLFRAPKALAWAGAVAVVVVGGGLALMTSREAPSLRDQDADRFAGRSAPAPGPTPSPPAASRLPAGDDAGSPSAANEATGSPAEQEAAPGAQPLDARVLAREQGAAATGKEELEAPASPRGDERAAGPARAMEMRPTGSGEEAAVRRKDMPPPATAAGGAATGNAPGESQIKKKTMAEPMVPQATPAPTSSTLDAGAQRQEGEQKSAAGAAAMRSIVEGEVRVCGNVRDAQDRPIAGAQVVASELGRSARADAAGRFCMSLPPGEHPVSVMAVGYSTIRRTLRTAGGEAALTLAAVPVLDGDPVGAAKRPATTAGAQEAVDRFAALPDSLRGVVREAERLEADAAARPSTARFDAAAAAWESALRSLVGGPLEVETRRHLSTVRYRAWELSPTAERARVAAEALGAYVTRAPAGPERAQAAARLERVRP